MTSEEAPGRRARGGAAQLLLDSPLFDEEWYALRTGASGDRADLVRHYLATPLGRRTSPHPLFDPEWFREQSGREFHDKDPFLVYLRRRPFGTPTHPAFGTVHYRRTVEGAMEHPHGPIAHYVEVGGPAGIPASRFHRVDAQGRGPDLRSWLLERHRALVEPSAPSAPVTPSDDVVTVVVPVPAAPGAWRTAWASVTPLVERGAPVGQSLQVLLVDLGADLDDAVKLDILTLRHEEVEVAHPVPGDPPRSTPESLADVAGRIRGTTAIVLGHDTEVYDDWIAPLVATLGEDDVAGVQPVVLQPDGTIASAGLLVLEAGGPGLRFLAGLPADDARGVEHRDFTALSGTCFALRAVDVARLTSDGAFACLPRPGRLAVTPESQVLQRDGSAVPPLTVGRRSSDVAAAWQAHGFEVTGLADGGATAHLRRLRPQVTETPPRLRWALKNAAPAAPGGEKWGDSHFASSLAAALREVGQEVVVDRREAFERGSSRHDDVHLLLRGLTPLRPPEHGVTLGWIISHPEEVHEREARSYDRVLAASVTWASEQSRRWGIEVEPLLQATDHRLFHPDSALPDSGDRVLFVGNSRGQYRPMVRDAVEQGVDLALYGAGWEELVPASLVRGAYVPNGAVSAAYRSAGVVLNDHWEDMRRDGFLSNRLFDAAASGARVLTDEVAGLGDLFGRSVQVVRTPADLARLSSLVDPDAVFGDDEERRQVAERIRRDHSFVARARRLVEVAADAVGRRR